MCNQEERQGQLEKINFEKSVNETDGSRKLLASLIQLIRIYPLKKYPRRSTQIVTVHRSHDSFREFLPSVGDSR